MDRLSSGGGAELAARQPSTGRRRPGLRRAAACFLAVCAAPLVLPYAGGADEPSRQGWWWQANANGAAAPAPPDVPQDGLYVQGGPTADQPTAFAAISFDLASGTTPKTLTLHLSQSQAVAPPAPVPAAPAVPAPAPPPAPAGGGAPPVGTGVQVCTIAAGTFNAEQGGPMADAPKPDCTKPVAGKTDLVAGTVTFDLSSLASGDSGASTLAVAVLPVSPTDRVAFQHPGSDALVVDTAPTSAPDFTPAPDSSVAPATSGDTSSALALPAVSAPEVATPSYVPGQASTGTPAVAAPAPRALPRARRPLVLATAKSSTATRVGQFAALGLVVAALISYSRGYGLLGGRFAED